MQVLFQDKIAESNYLLGGDGVINARAMLDKEVHEEVSYLRRKNPAINNGSPKYTINEILKWSDSEKEKVDVEVIDPMGSLVYKNNLAHWLAFKGNMELGVVAVRYFYNNEDIGSSKEVNFKKY